MSLTILLKYNSKNSKANESASDPPFVIINSFLLLCFMALLELMLFLFKYFFIDFAYINDIANDNTTYANIITKIFSLMLINNSFISIPSIVFPFFSLNTIYHY